MKESGESLYKEHEDINYDDLKVDVNKIKNYFQLKEMELEDDGEQSTTYNDIIRITKSPYLIKDIVIDQKQQYLNKLIDSDSQFWT